eukprot:2670490-Amphidinium_carterae.1
MDQSVNASLTVTGSRSKYQLECPGNRNGDSERVPSRCLIMSSISGMASIPLIRANDYHGHDAREQPSPEAATAGL